MQPLLIEHLCHLPIYSSQLGIVTICAEGICTFYSILITFESHGCLAVVVIGTAKEVVGKKAIVGSTVLIEKGNVWLNIADGKGLVVAITHIDAVKTGTHANAVSLRGAARKCQHHNNNTQQMFHDIVFPDTCMQMYKLISRIPNLREESYSDVGSLKRKSLRGRVLWAIIILYNMYHISLYRSRSAARTSFSSASTPRRAMRQKMAEMMGNVAVRGNVSGSAPCWMSTAKATYQRMLTRMAKRHMVACRGRCLNIKMAMSAMADASICMPKSSQPWKCTIPKMTAMSRKSDCLR